MPGADRTRSSTVTKNTEANLEDSALATNSIHQTRGGQETIYMMLRLAVVFSPAPAGIPHMQEIVGAEGYHLLLGVLLFFFFFLLGVLKTKGLLEVTIARRQG